jgi:hypothetical protein
MYKIKRTSSLHVELSTESHVSQSLFQVYKMICASLEGSSNLGRSHLALTKFTKCWLRRKVDQTILRLKDYTL